jgi:outer membrane protein assembly factor BamE
MPHHIEVDAACRVASRQPVGTAKPTFQSIAMPQSLSLPSCSFKRVPRRAILICCIALSWQLVGCQSLQSSGNVLGFITPYRLEVVQGNVVTKEQAALVKPGMTRSEVRDILGSPMLTDIFHADRWDYPFTIRRQGTAPQQRLVVLKFDGEALKTIEAPDLPTERDFVTSIDTKKTLGTVPVLALTDEQIKALPVPKAAPTPAISVTANPPARDYPPLEAR